MSEPLDTAADGLDTSTAETATEDHAPEADVSDRALNMGWTPKDQFKGDPEKWVDAAEYVRRGEELMPLLKANNRKLEKALEDQKRTVAKLVKGSADISARAYDQALKDLRAEHAAAVREGDVDAADDIADKMADLKAKPPEQVGDPDVEAWHEANPWYRTDALMRGAADAIDAELRSGGMTDNAKIREAAVKRIREAFPAKFENPRRREPGAVEGSGSARRSSGKGYADLPAEARSACDDFVKRGILTREKYIKDYFA